MQQEFVRGEKNPEKAHFKREVSGFGFSYVGDPNDFGLSFDKLNKLTNKKHDWSLDDNFNHKCKDLPIIVNRVQGMDAKPGESRPLWQNGYHVVVWEFAFQASYGGHNHFHPTELNWNNSIPQKVVLYSGERYIVRPYTVAGLLTERVTVYTDPLTGSMSEYSCRLIIPDLVDLGNSTSFMRIGQTSTHPLNHYVTSDVRSSLHGIANEYYAATGQALGYNDASLVWGGKFDIYGNFNNPHAEHMFGRSIDIAAVPAFMAHEEKFVEILRKYTTNYILEGTGPARHYHVRF